MKKYFIKTPWWLKRIFSSYLWSMDKKEKKMYLSFDDGPHPDITPYVLDLLKTFNAKATFFCIGKNVLAYPDVYKRIIDEGHCIGNHTFNHLNGWKTKDDLYLSDITKASQFIDSNLFRPPYGRISSFQARQLTAAMKRPSTIVMWDVISGDFDATISGDDCLKNVILNAGNGSIVVFHDSEKALDRLKYALPRVLQYYSERGYSFEKLTLVDKILEEATKLKKFSETGVSS